MSRRPSEKAKGKKVLPPWLESSQNPTELSSLSVEGRIAFELLKLIVDVKYDQLYGDEDVEKEGDNRYNESIKLNEEVQTDHQITPVDDGLSGSSQRELFGR